MISADGFARDVFVNTSVVRKNITRFRGLGKYHKFSQINTRTLLHTISQRDEIMSS